MANLRVVLNTSGTHYCKMEANSPNKIYLIGESHYYNWYAANGNIAPTGWHVPTYRETTDLINNLGGYSAAGGHLKETGTVHWASPNTGADNSSTFTAIPSGIRRYDTGEFINMTIYNTIWTNTIVNSTTAWYFNISYDSASAGQGNYAYSAGLTIRCIKDDSSNPGTVTDYDGNVYSCITIGSQVWMQTDLKVTHYNNGTAISGPIFSNGHWALLTTGAYCFYFNQFL